MKKWLLSLLTAVLAVSVLTACGSSDESGNGSEDEKVLKMATSADYKPFEYIDTAKSDEIIGFDVDLAKAIAGKLGYKVEVVDMDFGGLVTAVKNGQADFVMAGMTPTEEREKNVDFSDIYYTANHMIVTSKDNKIESVKDLENKTVGVQMGSIQEEKAQELAKTTKMTVENRDKIPELVQEIKSERFDAAIIEDLVAQGYLDKNEDLTGFLLEGDAEEVGSAIAFKKGSELRDQFNEELKKMKENGELEELVLKWFGGDAE
ncbi:transporter substrate-binding domain-containing protein [Pradoshia sp. D12]|uniref:transporter substrate-binding domain-containing protein n=1 Tax=Bacillaceae TaxID=186817 RepID=UPI00080AF972|nr:MULTISPECIES: transporter substrate-binding domain-containing protein [Bacillaceae]OCA86309.1 ABC transporter substrate-binding protein [Bacillus sp. FJAT-27986]QFK72109.1 transporter substrate-binding domain-containing protein [Pradoshia sp. D12]TPF71399.1 transporter substrate-binding domain-containing protein [Bacillus sp. D12]